MLFVYGRTSQGLVLSASILLEIFLLPADHHIRLELHSEVASLKEEAGMVLGSALEAGTGLVFVLEAGTMP